MPFARPQSLRILALAGAATRACAKSRAAVECSPSSRLAAAAHQRLPIRASSSRALGGSAMRSSQGSAKRSGVYRNSSVARALAWPSTGGLGAGSGATPPAESRSRRRRLTDRPQPRAIILKPGALPMCRAPIRPPTRPAVRPNTASPASPRPDPAAFRAAAPPGSWPLLCG